MQDKRQKARHEQETRRPTVGQKRPPEEVLAGQEDLLKRFRNINSMLDQLEEQQRSRDELRSWRNLVLYAGAHASFA